MIGEQVENFRIVNKLGEGGMGVVYKAMDVQLERPVAIKMLTPELSGNPEIVERFRTEARAQANLSHTNLATLYAFFVHEGSAFIVMEFVEGENFEQLISRCGPLAPEDAIPWFKQALLGVGAAHRMGIVHRDLKPANLMLNRQGIVKVMDFGIAKVLGVRGITRTGMQLGTAAYMSPEQIRGLPVDSRTDIYALGITLYQMLSGHVPFEHDSDFDIMHDQVNTPPPQMISLNPYAPVRYQTAVMRAIEKNPEDRYRSVEDFGAALERPDTVTAPIAGLFEPSTNRTLDQHKTLAENGVIGGQRLSLRKKETKPPVEWKKFAIVAALIAAVAVTVVIGQRIVNWFGHIVTPTVAVSIEPKGPVRLFPSKTQKFSATVEHGKTTAVRWFIEPTFGFVSSEGVYTAPSSVLSPQTVMVTAQSQDDPRKSATASISLIPPPIRVDPPTATLGPNQSAQFRVEPAEFSVAQAEQLGAAVDWSLDPAVGTITPAGIYTSPAHIQKPQTVTLIATSKTDPTNSARATISLTQSPTAQLTISPQRVSLTHRKIKIRFCPRFQDSASSDEFSCRTGSDQSRKRQKSA